MKAIIIGTSLSGKTTLIRHLRSLMNEPISEMDEELTIANGGEFPMDNKQKNEVLAPKVIEMILATESILFFTNTDYFSDKDLNEAHKKGFKIIQLDLDIEVLKKRNAQRVKTEGYSDLSEWLEGMVLYQENIRKEGCVDAVINIDQPVEDITKELLAVLQK